MPQNADAIVHKPLDYVFSYFIEGEWVAMYKAEYVYSPVTATAVFNVPRNEFQIFPNPATNVVTVATNSSNAGSFTLFDAQGRELISENIANNTQVNLSSVANGLYMYTITVDGKRQKGTLIKKS